jgi:hypothetical protein
MPEAVAPAAPIVPAKEEGFVPPEESIIQTALREALGELPPEATHPAEGDEEGKGEPEPEPIPEKEEKKKDEKDATAPAFTVFGEDGKTPIAPPKMLVEFKANGKVRQEPLDRVVQFAQFGVYNHEREQNLQRAQEEMTEEVRGVYAELDQREAAIERLLTDPEYLEAVRERYLQEKSPEREASRAKAEAEQLRAQMQQTASAEQGQKFFAEVVFPSIEAIMRENPELDDPEEVAARLALMLEPMRENGKIPLKRHREIEALIASDLRDWAKATNDRRAQRTVKAQAHEQRAKNALGAVASPTSIGAAPAPRRERTGPVTIDEVDQDIMQETIRAMRVR